MRSILFRVALAVALCTGIAHAQESGEVPTPEEIKDRLDGADERLTTLENDVNKLKTVKISGYIQNDWQHFDQNTTVGGRAIFSDARKHYFTVRRGRIKIQHKLDELMVSTLEADFTERGVAVKDAYATVNILPEELLTLNVGLFAKPEYEVEVSSSVRESPEHSQIALAFYPTERDLGVMLSSTFQLFEDFSPRLQLGAFNGEGIAPDVDSYKDIIARLTFPLPLGSNSPVQIDLGGSFFYGGIPQTGAMVIKTIGESNETVDNDETGSLAGWGNRQNVNVESQIYLDLLPFGGTIIKGEFFTGKRPTTATSGTAASIGIGKDSLGADIPVVKPAVAGKPLQIRNQSGFYAVFVQNIGAQVQVVAKFENYDRNTDLTGETVTSTSDASTTILGFGALFFFNNIRITAWYEMPSFSQSENAKRDAAGAIVTTDDIKDNKTTIRFQYKF